MMIAVFLSQARATEFKEIESVTVLADSRLAVPLSQLATMFAHKNMISVASVFGLSADQKKKIEDGEPADLFITADREMVQQLKIKGLVDVHSIGTIAASKSAHFVAAVVAGENMTPAREFLEYLKSPEAKAVFKHSGLTAP